MQMSRAGESVRVADVPSQDLDARSALILTDKEWDALEQMAASYLTSTAWYEVEKAGLYDDIDAARRLAARIIEAST